MTPAIAKRLGYTIERRMTRWGYRWFCAPNGTPPNVDYGRPHRDEAGALAVATERVAYRLGVGAAQIEEHLARLLTA